MTPSSEPSPMLRAEGLSRSFGPTTALSDVSLSVYRGELVAVLGPNGAGKTTLLSVLTGSLSPTRGTVWIDGAAVDARDPSWRGAIGVVSHRSGLYGHLSALENLRFFGRLQGLDALDDRIEQALEDVGMSEHADRPCREFSRGMAQRLAIARATLHDPQILLCDEPFTGLDTAAVRSLEERLDGLKAEGRGIVLVTHRAASAGSFADRILLLNRGQTRYYGSDFPRDDGLESFLARRAEGRE